MFDKNNKVLVLGEVFSFFPGGRWRKNGPHSGEEFREDFFVPWLKAHDNPAELVIKLDGPKIYISSFLEEVFGGAIRINNLGDKVPKIKIVFSDDQKLKLIHSCIQDALKLKKK